MGSSVTAELWDKIVREANRKGYELDMDIKSRLTQSQGLLLLEMLENTEAAESSGEYFPLQVLPIQDDF